MPKRVVVLNHDHDAEVEGWLRNLHQPMPMPRCPGCWIAFVKGPYRHGVYGKIWPTFN